MSIVASVRDCVGLTGLFFRCNKCDLNAGMAPLSGPVAVATGESSFTRAMSNPHLIQMVPIGSMQPVLDLEAEVNATKREEVAAYHRVNSVMYVMSCRRAGEVVYMEYTLTLLTRPDALGTILTHCEVVWRVK